MIKASLYFLVLLKDISVIGDYIQVYLKFILNKMQNIDILLIDDF
jgi:hypothetical protein